MNKRNMVGLIAFLIVSMFFVFGAFLMETEGSHPFGYPSETDMDDKIINGAQTETEADNTVTAVVFDYRGFDTLGEATVLFTAVAGVILIFRKVKK